MLAGVSLAQCLLGPLTRRAPPVQAGAETMLVALGGHRGRLGRRRSPIPPSMPPVGVPKTLHTEPETRNAPGQPQQRHKTQAADRQPPGTQVAQHRSAPPLGQDSLLLAS